MLEGMIYTPIKVNMRNALIRNMRWLNKQPMNKHMIKEIKDERTPWSLGIII